MLFIQKVFAKTSLTMDSLNVDISFFGYIFQFSLGLGGELSPYLLLAQVFSDEFDVTCISKEARLTYDKQ